MTTSPTSEEATETREVRRLRKRLVVSRQVHGLSSDPMMAAVRVDQLMRSVTRWLWFFLGCGLAFTTSGVQAFLAEGYTPSDPVWWGCWLVEPALAGILVHLLRWQAEMLSRGIAIDSNWVSILRWFLLTCTLVMNIVPVLGGNASRGMLFAHGVVPILVFLLAEVMPVIQARCVEARQAALADVEPESVPAEEKAGTGSTPNPAPVAPAQPVPAFSAPSTPEPSTPVVQAVPALTVPAGPSAPVAPPLALDGLGIPAPMQASIRELVTSLALDGRRATAEDVAAATRLPASIASKVVERIPVNGHTH